jgi:hypothetical protein
LFLEILPAPTTDTMKVRQEEDVASSQDDVNTRKLGRRLPNSIVPWNGSLPHQRRGVLTRNSRLIPSSTSEAYTIALASTRHILQTVQKDSEKMRSRRNTETYQLTVQRHKSIRKEKANTNNGQLVDRTVENLFAELCVDMAEQRKALPTEVQQDFDKLWGYVLTIPLISFFIEDLYSSSFSAPPSPQ